ncbi:hypothetical protein NFJ02_24g54520 [Pycnococcus provasolii]
MFIFASCGCFIVGVDAGIGKGLDEQINQQVLQMQAKPLAEKLAKQDVFVEQLIAKAQMGLGEQMGDGELPTNRLTGWSLSMPWRWFNSSRNKHKRCWT